jgi:hypothetical protein
MQIFGGRTQYRFGKIETGVLAVYAAILAWVIPHHESWVDEAQSWLIARDSSLHDLLWTRLRHEGSPGLWYLVCWIAARLHISFAGIHWIAGVFACAGVVVLLRYAPFPALIRYLLPFTFFIQYQYAVIARTYVLFPLLLFALLAIMTGDKPRPIWFALFAGLLANVSMHGAACAGGLAMVYIFRLRRWAQRENRGWMPRRAAAACAVLAAFWLIALVTAFPDPDTSFGGPVARKLSVAVFSIGHARGGPTSNPNAVTNLASARPEIYIAEPTGLNHWQHALWQKIYRPVPTHQKNKWILVGKTLQVVGLLSYPISSSNLLASALLVLLVLWLRRRRGMINLIPYLLIFLFSGLLHVDVHHTGLLWLAILGAVWMSWNDPLKAGAEKSWVDDAFPFTLFVVILVQMGWSAYAVASDVRKPYAGDKAAAAFIQDHAQGKRVSGFDFGSIPLQPYFSRNIYFNQSTTFWPWSYRYDQSRDDAQVLGKHPDFVVTSNSFVGDEYLDNQIVPLAKLGAGDADPSLVQLAERLGYQETHRFCGWNFIRFGYSREQCVVILEPAPPHAAR